MRIAFFGGTFDPIHRGHLAIASAAAGAFALDRVLLAPVGRQPLKARAPVASFTDRLEMTRLACQGVADAADPSPSEVGEPACRSAATNGAPEPRFAVSTLDAPRPEGGPNYTVDALTALALEYPGAALFALIGADSLPDLRRWRAPDRLLALAEWIVVSRPEFPLDPAALYLPQLALTPAQRARVHMLATVHEDVSATELRRRLRTGDPCPGLLPPGVAAYIQEHHLYIQEHHLHRDGEEL